MDAPAVTVRQLLHMLRCLNALLGDENRKIEDQVTSKVYKAITMLSMFVLDGVGERRTSPPATAAKVWREKK